MPRIDPLKLLTCLKVLLASNGGIRSAAEVKRLAGLMTKYSKKLVSKCIYIQILKCTETDLLGQFMGLGGWSLTHMWLSDGIRAENWPLVQEILELLLLCPVDVQRLRSNTSPKLVKGLCKDGGNEGVRILAAKLVEQWLKVVKGETREMSQAQNVNSPTPIKAINMTSNAAVQETAATLPESRLPQHIVIESDKVTSPVTASVTTVAGTTTIQSVDSAVEGDPLAVPSETSVELSQQTEEQKKINSALVYRLMIKDGKQVLAKVENNSFSKETAPSEQYQSVVNNEKGADATLQSAVTAEDGKISDKIMDREIEKMEKEKDSDSSKDNKENKEKDKSKSSKDKEKHREHKTSSHHKSSSSSKPSSTKTSSNSSSSSSTKSRSSSSSHRTSSDGKTRDKDSEKDKHRSSSSSSKDKHKDYRDKEKSSSRDKEKDKKESRNKDRDKEKEKSKVKEKEREDSKEKEKSEQAEKDKDTLSKIAPASLEKLGRIPKKPKDENGLSGSSAPTSITIPSKKASMSIEIRKDTERPKTVKTYNSQFRSHGLTDEVPPPPSRKGLKKPSSQPSPGTSILSNLSLKRSSPPPSSSSSSSKDLQPAEKKPKIDMNAAPSGSSEKPGAIKLIAPKPKPSTLVESDMFMDALSASALMKKDNRKRKRRPSATKETSKDSNSSATSPPESPASDKVAAPLKFYQDTLEDNKEEDKLGSTEDKDRDSIKDKDKESEKNEDEDDIPLKRVKEAIEQKVQREKDEEEEDRKSKDEDSNEESEEPPIKKPPGPGCGPNGPPGVLMLHRRKGPKKKLTWKTQDELEEIRYFELDETERVNVTKTFVDMKHMERMNEREAFLLARKLNCEDTMTEQTAWMPLILVDDVPPHPEGNQSKEKRIQAEREQTTLKALYFNRHMIPDSPAEPDMEQYQITEPAVIPLDDITGNPDAVNDFTSMPWPDPKGSPPQGGESDFMPFNSNQFNPFMPFGQPQWPMQPGAQGPGQHPNGVISGGLMGPLGGFNNMNNMNINMNLPPNIMLGPKPDDMQMNVNMGMIAPFGPTGPGPNFAGPPNPGTGGFNNFGPPPNLNMNMNQQNFSPPRLDQNMNRGGPRGPIGGGNNRGNWRSGGPPNQSGGNWRPQGAGGGGGAGGGNFGNNWIHGNRNRICKQFQRGHCRNGNKCNFLHPTNSHRI